MHSGGAVTKARITLARIAIDAAACLCGAVLGGIGALIWLFPAPPKFPVLTAWMKFEVVMIGAVLLVGPTIAGLLSYWLTRSRRLRPILSTPLAIAVSVVTFLLLIYVVDDEFVFTTPLAALSAAVAIALSSLAQRPAQY
jgi:hypothetical protein